MRVVALLWLMTCGAAVAAPSLHLRVEAVEHSAGIRRIAVSPNGELIATVSDDKTGRLWRASDRRLLTVLRVPVGDGDIGRLYGVAFSPDGRQIAVGGTSADAAAPHRIDIFETANGAHLRSLVIDAGHIVRLLWTHNGRHLAACLQGRDGLRIVDANDGRIVYSEAFSAPCFGLAEMPDGGLLASGWDAQIRQLRLEGGTWRVANRIRTEIADPQSIAVSPDGQHFVVGYRSRPPSGNVAVDVFDANTLLPARRFSFFNLRGGSLGSVAWSADGRTIAASGRADLGDGRHVLQRISWPQGAISSELAAADTVQDMAPFGTAGFALASSTGAWGVVAAAGPVQALGASVVDMRGADSLRADDSLRTVAFGRQASQEAFRFSLASRQLLPGGYGGLDSAKRLSFGLAVTQWQDQWQPVVAGKAVAMEPLEVSRCYALLPDNAGVVLGTSRSLRRFDRQGNQQWLLRVASEVRSLTVSRDGRLIVSAQLDGTVRWWRASDGALLLSLFVSVDGRWALWTEQGYYDAGVGAESLIGWHLNRSDGLGVDFYSIGKFRDKYHRPDVIDRVLETADPAIALDRANAARGQHVSAGPPAAEPFAEPAARVIATPVIAAAEPIEKMLPPVVSVYNERTLNGDSTQLRVAFSVRADAAPADTMIVRVNGRPAEVAELLMPGQQDGRALGHVLLQMPARDADVTVMAQAGTLVSEPVHLAWSWRPPLAASVPPSPIQPPSKAMAAVAPLPAPAPASAANAAAATADATATGNTAANAAAFSGTNMGATHGVNTGVNGAPIGSATPNAGIAVAANAPPSRLFFVAIGISKYARKEYELGLAAKDATDFAALMSGQGGLQYASVQSRVLVDEGATRSAVLSALDWLRQSVGPGDTGMLFIAGHGVNDSSGRYFFMPHDADVANLARSSVSEAQLRNSLAGIKGKAVLFADTCFAGKVVGTGAALNNEISRLANTLSSAENGVIVFSSSTGRQPSIEQAAWGNGAFTKALVEGLKGGADFRKDGVVTHQGLSYYLGREVAKLTAGRQTPVTAVPLGVADYTIASVAAR